MEELVRSAFEALLTKRFKAGKLAAAVFAAGHTGTGNGLLGLEQSAARSTAYGGTSASGAYLNCYAHGERVLITLRP